MKRTALLISIVVVSSLQANVLSAESPEDILVIVNKAVTVGKISESELRDVFLKKKENWSNGVHATPLHSSSRSLKADFCKRLLKMDIGEEERFWQANQIKTGKSKPPSFMNTLKAVYKLRGAVSYIYRSQYKEGIVKIAYVLAAN